MRYAYDPAISSFVIGILCLLELFGIFPRFSGTLMAIQFVVIHSSMFIFAVPLLNAEDRTKSAVFAVLITLYSVAAFSIDGLLGIAEFAALTYSTYYGYIFRKTSEAARVPLLLRWLYAFMVFLFAITVTNASGDVDSWPGSGRLAYTGAVFFGCLGLMELSGFYEEGWKKLVRGLTGKDPGLRGSLPAWLVKELYPDRTEPPPGGDNKI